MSYTLHLNDLPDDLQLGNSIAVDSETMGLLPWRDRLCVVQLSSGDDHAHIIQFKAGNYEAPNLKKILLDKEVLKIFHYARFDMAVFQKYLGVVSEPVYCTKIASRLCRTFTDRHGLRDLCRDLLGVEVSKEKQSSDWGAAELSREQLAYAANDVLYLHRIKDKLEEILIREGRQQIAHECHDFLKTRVAVDLAGWPDWDIFAH